jgi:hypothetical protein
LEPDFAPSLPDVRELVVGEALAHLDNEGHFILPDLGVTRRSAISSRDAERIALAYVARVANGSPVAAIPGLQVRSVKAGLEDTHGRPIDWDRLRVGKRPPYIVREYLEALPDSIPPAVQNYFGPHYLVPLHVGDRQILTVSVAAYTPIFVDAQGQLDGSVGNDIWPFAIPHGAATWHPLPPEVAVKQAVEFLGARVSALPYLLQPGHNVSISNSVWVLQLDREIEVRRISDGVVVRSATIYTSQFPSFTDSRPGDPFAFRLFVAADDQPDAERVAFRSSSGGTRELLWPVRAGAPVNFVEVIPPTN